MTDPDVAGLRAGLDRLEQQARDATYPGVHWFTAGGLRRVTAAVTVPEAELVAFWSPDRVLGWCAAIRTIIDGLEATLARHYENTKRDDPQCRYCLEYEWPCPDYRSALAGLSSLAGVLTEGGS